MITFHKEGYTSELQKEVMPLLEKHWEEIAHDKTIPLDIDWVKYAAMWKSGAMTICTARDDTKLVGYSVFFTHTHMHYKGHKFALQDILFVDPESRNSRIGIQLIKFSEEILKLNGVHVVLHHMKVAHDFSPIMERLGYDFMEKIYSKRLN
jgi:GNAT superfamily N-acetyltransferase